MKALPALLLSALLLLPAGASARRPERGGRPAPPLASSAELDFGAVVPEGGAVEAAAEVFAGSEGPFDASLRWEGWEEAAPRFRRCDLALRCGEGPFVALSPGAEVPLGRVGAPGGLLRIEGRLSLPWEVRPGPIRITLRLSLGEGTEIPLRLRGEAAEVLLLDGVPGRWIPERDPDPSRETAVSFGSRTLTVRANVPWRLQARLSSGGGLETGTLFRWASLLFRLAGGRSEALAPGRPSELLRGGPTPASGVAVEVEPVLVFTGLPEEGTLELPLELRLTREDTP